MKFGNVDINVIDVDFSKWTYEDFLVFYKDNLKGKITETHEQVAKALGVVIPEKVKPDKVKPAVEA